MSRVTRQEVTPTKQFKVKLQAPVHTKVQELEKLLAADSYNWNMHKEFSEAIEKVVKSAISDIEKLKKEDEQSSSNYISTTE